MADSNPDFSATGSWLVPQQAQFLVDLEHSHGEEQAIVRAVRRLGLAVVVEEVSPIRAGSWIDKATLRTEHGPLPLRFLQVQTRKPDPFGTVLELRTDDPRSVAALWSYLYEQRLVLTGEAWVGEARNYEALRVPRRRVFNRETWNERSTWLQEVFGQEFPALQGTRLDPVEVEGNVENFIGSVEVPVGLAGPMMFHGRYAKGLIMAPMATSEGALVASTNRGARAVTVAGGVTTHVIHQRMIRAPVFVADRLESALRLQAWIMDHEVDIRAQTSQVGRHARLVQLDPVLIGRNLHLRFVFETGDAAGQNMSTLATWRACQWIRAQIAYLPDIRIENFFVEANTSGDKKATALSYAMGRGFRVTAEALLPPIALSRLRVDADTLLRLNDSGITGSVYAGMMGMNVNFANVIAALFVATGQDIASVHESAVGQFHLERCKDGVRAYLLLPNLVVGSVGGGTRLPGQQECLQIMGAYGRAKAARLAEIIAGYCLALDLSTMSAIAAGHFASAHENLGRSHNQAERLEPSLLPELCGRSLRKWLRLEPKDELTIHSVTPIAGGTHDSVMGSLGAGDDAGSARHGVFETSWRMTGTTGTSRFLVKSKPTDHEVIRLMRGMAKLCGEPLASMYEVHQYRLGLRNCHVRELEMAKLDDPRFTSITPEFLAVWRDDTHAAYIIVMEYLENVSHLNSARQPQLWRPEHIGVALRDIARFHSMYIGREEELKKVEWLDISTASMMQEMAPLWEAIVQHNARQFPAVFTSPRVAALTKGIERIAMLWREIEAAPRTLIHNDFNLRNVCLRRTGDDFRLCAYDWELATLHVPQRDVCEFLSFVLPPGTPRSVRLEYLRGYRHALEEASKRTYDAAEFERIYDLACFDFAINRLALLTIAQGLNVYEFLPRVLHSHLEYLDGCSI
jgi:NADP-dependent 3-hydroxy-3-methylglutaryl-CoA reductase